MKLGSLAKLQCMNPGIFAEIFNFVENALSCEILSETEDKLDENCLAGPHFNICQMSVLCNLPTNNK